MSPRTMFAATMTSAMMLIGTASAQNVAKPPTGFRISNLATVYVLDNGGKETKGELLQLNPDGIAIEAEDGSIHHYEFADVRRIQKRGDSVANGTIAGAIVGTVLGVIVARFVHGSVGAKALGILANTCLYASVGAGIDALIPGRSTIFDAGTTMSTEYPRPLARQAFPGRMGMTFAVTW